ncbi:MAG: glycosyltransferase family 2 protein [Rikenellaceae bacterium]
MDISVIVPIYNVENYIERCLRSLFEQTKTDGVEFILVNDCTPDNSMKEAYKVIEEYFTLDVKVLENSENIGVSQSRGIATDCAKGEYVLYVDSDDWCEPSMLEMLYVKAVENRADVVVSDYYSVINNIKIYQKVEVSKDNIECLKLLLDGGFNPQLWNKLIRRSLIVDNDLYLNNKYIFGEDALIICKLLCFVEKISYLPNAIINYYNRDSSVSNNLTNEHLQSIVDVHNEMIEFVNNLINKEQNRYLESSIRWKKMHVKFFIIKKSEGKEQKDFAKIYPEVTPYIWGEFNRYGFHNKLVLWFASKGCIPLANCILNLIKQIKY